MTLKLQFLLRPSIRIITRQLNQYLNDVCSDNTCKEGFHENRKSLNSSWRVHESSILREDHKLKCQSSLIPTLLHETGPCFSLQRPSLRSLPFPWCSHYTLSQPELSSLYFGVFGLFVSIYFIGLQPRKNHIYHLFQGLVWFSARHGPQLSPAVRGIEEPRCKGE